MKSVVTIEIGDASKRYVNQAGFLVLPDCSLARSGILDYSDVTDQDGTLIKDGAIIKVYRPAKALKECCSEFANLPLTLEHPSNSKVDPNNAKKVVVGSLGSEPKYEEKNGVAFIKSDIIVYDKDTIDEIQNGEYSELSAGYETAFKKERGLHNGEQYEAVQYLLVPNHVALVRNGRCGSECRICDSKEETKKGAEMKKWYLMVGDEKVVPLTEEEKDKIQQDEDIEIEEMTSDEFEKKFEEIEEDEDIKKKKDKDEKKDEDEYEETEVKEEVCPVCHHYPCICEEEEETSEDEDEKKDEDECDEDLKKKKDEDLNKKKDRKGCDEDDLVYEVQFDDGTIGKMDEAAYNKVQRYMDVMEKKGDAAETVASLTLLTSQASKIIGDSFDVEKYITNKKVDTAEIKKAVIKKVCPNLVVDGLDGKSLNQVYRMAVKTSRTRKDAWKRDVDSLTEASKKSVGDSEESPIAKARENYLKRIHNHK